MTSRSATTTEIQNRLTPVQLGEVLAEEFLKPLGLSANALAKQIGVPRDRISIFAAGKRAITRDTALRLADALGTTPKFWMNLQMRWELETEREKSILIYLKMKSKPPGAN